MSKITFSHCQNIHILCLTRSSEMLWFSFMQPKSLSLRHNLLTKVGLQIWACQYHMLLQLYIFFLWKFLYHEKSPTLLPEYLIHLICSSDMLIEPYSFLIENALYNKSYLFLKRNLDVISWNNKLILMEMMAVFVW